MLCSIDLAGALVGVFLHGEVVLRSLLPVQQNQRQGLLEQSQQLRCGFRHQQILTCAVLAMKIRLECTISLPHPTTASHIASFHASWAVARQQIGVGISASYSCIIYWYRYNE